MKKRVVCCSLFSFLLVACVGPKGNSFSTGESASEPIQSSKTAEPSKATDCSETTESSDTAHSSETAQDRSSSSPNSSKEADTYLISFDANGGSGKMSPLSAEKNEKIILPSSAFTRTGFTFDSWKLQNSFYKAGDSFLVQGNATFYANWNEDPPIGQACFNLKEDDYQIVYRDGNESDESVAKELAESIKKLFGKTAVTVSDRGIHYQSGSRYLSVGRTSFLNDLTFSNGASYSDWLISHKGNDSFLLATSNRTYCMVGNNDNGTRYAVYQFLEDLGIRYLTPDFTYYPANADGGLSQTYKSFSPEFAYRQYLNSSTYQPNNDDEIQYARHMRFNGDYLSDSLPENKFNWYTDSAIGTAHNTTAILSPSKYQAKYPNMFVQSDYLDVNYLDGIREDGSIDKSTSEIDTASEAMAYELSQVIAKSEEDDFYLSVAQTDEQHYAESEDIAVQVNKYRYSGILIRFWNAVIKELLETYRVKKNFNLVMLAYQFSLTPPVDNHGNVLDETCIPNDHLWVRIAPISFDRYLSYDSPYQGAQLQYDYESKKLFSCGQLANERGSLYDSYWDYENKDPSLRVGSYSAKNLYSDWSNVTKNMFTWAYAANYDGWYAYSGLLANMAHNLELFKSSGIQYVFVQGMYGERTAVSQYLDAYVMSRLCWDLNQDATELRNEFVRLYFGEKSYSLMKKYYDGFDEKYASLFMKNYQDGPSSEYKENGIGYQYRNIFGGYTWYYFDKYGNSHGVEIKPAIDKEFYLAQKELLESAKKDTSSLYQTRIERERMTPYFMLAKVDSSYRSDFLSAFKAIGGKNLAEGQASADSYAW